MDVLLALFAFFIGLFVGPLVVRKIWPARSRCSGDMTAGECGSSPVFWGIALALAFFTLAVAAKILAGPGGSGSQATKFEIAAALVGMLVLCTAPIIVCGLHTWKWNPDGLEFMGVFRRQSILWRDVASVRRLRGSGWTFCTTDRSKLSTSDSIPGAALIIASFSATRPDLAKQVASAIESERQQ